MRTSSRSARATTRSPAARSTRSASTSAGRRPSEELERFGRCCRARADARRASRTATDRRRRGRVPVPALGARRVVPCGGRRSSACYPTHRRRGVLRALMRAQLDDVHERGEPIAALWASEERIYGRFGYGLAALAGEIELAATRTRVRAPLEPRGRVRLVEPDEALELFPPLWDAVRASDAGHVRAHARPGGRTRVCATRPSAAAAPARSARRCSSSTARPRATRSTGTRSTWEEGSPTGSARGRRGDRRDAARRRASSGASCSTSTGRRRSRRTCCRPTTRSSSCSPSRGGWVPHRRRALGAARRRRRGARGAAYAERRPRRPRRARRVLPVERGPLALAGGRRRATDDEPDLALDVAALGAAYLGGFTFAELCARAAASRSCSPGAIDRADAIFRHGLAPWCPEIF